MSADLVVYVEHKNENSWERLDIFDKKGEKVTWRLFDNTAIEVLFDHDESIVYPRGLPNDVLPDMKKDWGDCESLCTYFDWCELQALSRTPEAMKVDWFEADGIEDKKDYPKYNALEGLVRSINLLIDCNEVYCVKPYEVRVICCLSV